MNKDVLILVAMGACVVLGAVFWATLAARHTQNPARKRPVWLGVFLGLLALVLGVLWFFWRA